MSQHGLQALISGSGVKEAARHSSMEHASGYFSTLIQAFAQSICPVDTAERSVSPGSDGMTGFRAFEGVHCV